jgi:L-2-hydroxyglutarate oxidase LhgO
MEHVEAVVIGAGLVGLAVARELARDGREVLILDAEKKIGSATSSRNSCVVHAGIYYPQRSLKARCCVEGRKALYAYAEERRIPHLKCGKLIVATNPEQRGKLADIQARAKANGVDDLLLLSAKEVRELEPQVSALAGLLSPSTGIIDVHELMNCYLADAENHGATAALGCPLESGTITDDGFILNIGGPAPLSLSCSILVNAAGFGAQKIAQKLEGFDPTKVPPRHLAKGNYFSLSGAQPFSHLVYPVPEAGGLGVHATLDLAGQVRFGPDVEWIDEVDYHVTPERSARFYDLVRRYWPGLKDGALRPDYSGIRPKVCAQGEPDADFILQGPLEHGIPQLVNLFGIESPGLTSSLAIAERVAEMVGVAGLGHAKLRAAS